MSLSSFAQSSRNQAGLKSRLPRSLRRAVLHLCPDLDPADPAREAVDLAILTQRSGGRALIASGGGPLVTEAERAAVRHRRVPLDGHGIFIDWRNRVQLTALVQREKPALLHAHGIEVLPRAIGLSRTHQIPLVADLTQPLPENPRVQRLMRHLAQSAALVRVPSHFILEQIKAKFGFPAQRIRHIPPGIDMQWYKAGSISAERLHGLSHLWRLPEQAGVALMPMPLQPGLGHDIFLEALASMKYENIFAVLIGSDRHAIGLRQELEDKVHQLGLNGKVVMPEFCTDWPTAFWLASVIIAPNIAPQGQNRSLLAAQAMGRPVIVTDSGANREMVQSGATAWITQPGDTKALATALRQAMHLTTEQRLDMAAATRDFVAEHFPQEVWFEAMTGLYDTLLRPAGADVEAQAA
jgi:glycosyltransferase involved in cell wall biosynthesis